jgi:hypothetical protein
MSKFCPKYGLFALLIAALFGCGSEDKPVSIKLSSISGSVANGEAIYFLRDSYDLDDKTLSDEETWENILGYASPKDSYRDMDWSLVGDIEQFYAAEIWNSELNIEGAQVAVSKVLDGTTVLVSIPDARVMVSQGP